MKNIYIKITVILSMLLTFNAQAYVTVGWSQDCDYNESITTGQIQNAIDDGHSEIRVINTLPFTEQIDIGSNSLVIKGAYDTCTDAENDEQSTVLTQINGEDITFSAFIIDSQNNPTSVTIDGFEIFNVAENGNGVRGSGIKLSRTTGFVLLKNIYVHNNNWTDGGVEILNKDIPSSLNLTLTNVISANNKAFRGGGLNCASNGLTEITINGMSGFSFNEVQNIGGGMSLNDCHVIFDGGTLSPGELDFKGINGNIALSSGGGIAAFNGSQVQLIGNQSTPFNITNNQARNGGGIYTAGNGAKATQIELSSTWLANNQAERYGGAVYAPFLGGVRFNPTEECEWNDLCHLVENNIAEDAGGAFYIEGSGRIEINKAEITGSRSGNSGTVAALRNDNSNLSINSSLIHKNGGVDHSEYSDGYAIRNLSGNVGISINYSTFADNEVQYATITPFDNDGSSLLGIFSIVGSVIADDVSAIDYATLPDNWTATAVLNCAIFKEIFTNPDTYLVYEQVIEGEPTFIDATNGNYRLDATDLVAIDRCDEVSYPANLATDVDGHIRPFDVPEITDDLGSMDIGYDEVFLDLIFKSSFEN